MSSTLQQLQYLTEYTESNLNSVDELFAATIAKLFEREQKRMQALIERLSQEIETFEAAHTMNSNEFEERYESGALGDDIDFIEWSATIDMLKNAQKRFEILNQKEEEDEPSH